MAPLETFTLHISPAFAKKLSLQNKQPVTVKADELIYPANVFINKKSKLDKYFANNGCIPNELLGRKFIVDRSSHWLFAKSFTFTLIEWDSASIQMDMHSHISLSDLASTSNLCSLLHQELMKNKLLSFKTGMKISLQYLTQKFLFVVKEVVPCFFGELNSLSHISFRCFEGTKIEITEEKKLENEENCLTFEHFAGYKEEIKALQENIDNLFKGKRNASGILISGISGVGKTLIGNILSSLYKDKFIFVASEDILSPYKGESEVILKRVFSRAYARAPSIVFIDGISEICSNRNYSTKNTGIVNALLYLMDGVQNLPSEDVMVISTATHPETLDQALRRPGRLSHDIVLSPPDKEDRVEILECILKKFSSCHITKDLVNMIASKTSGFVAVDLIALISEAFSYTENVIPSTDDFMKALCTVKPSSMKNVVTYSCKVTLDNIFGLQTLKSELMRVFTLSLQHRKLFADSGITAPSRILLFGPTGCGKSLVVHGTANHLNLVVIPVTRAKVFGKYFGESEKNIASIFDQAQKCSPCILHFENFDGIAGRKQKNAEVSSDVEGRVINQLKVMLDGVLGFENIFVLAETNRPDLLDKDVIRQGRFHKYFHVDLPSIDERRALTQDVLKEECVDETVLHNLTDTLSFRTQGFSFAEVILLCKEIKALREQISPLEVLKEDEVKSTILEEAFETVVPGTSFKMEKKYKDFSAVYCRKI